MQRQQNQFANLENFLNSSPSNKSDLQLCETRIGAYGIYCLINTLSKYDSLQNLKLELGDDHFIDEYVSQLGQIVAKQTNLQNLSLKLYNNELGSQGVQALFSQFEDNISVSSLSISIGLNKIGDQGALFLGQRIQAFKNLQSLKICLPWNSIKASGGSKLCSGLKKWPNISNLIIKIKRNEIGDSGLQGIAQAIGKFNTLSTVKLKLGKNCIETEKDLYFGFTKYINLNILELDFSWNNLDDQFTHIIGSDLKNCQYIYSLTIRLTGNNITVLGVSDLISNLEVCPNIISLTLDLGPHHGQAKYGFVNNLKLKKRLLKLKNLVNLSFKIFE
ncbi:hypothetical protein ABPG73_002075 [Tetrahymena malaccensis]